MADFPTRRLCLSLLAALAAPQLGALTRLRVFGDDHYIPLSYLDQGQPRGLLVDRLRAAEPALGQGFEIELLAWKRAMSQAEEGQGGIVGVSINKARSAWMDFSAPIHQDDIHLVVRRDRGFRPASLQELKNRLIGIGNGVSYGEELEQAISAKLFRVTRDWGIQRRLRIALSGKVDGVFIGSGASGYEAALRADAELWARREELLWIAEPMVRDRLHLGFAKRMQQQPLLERFNAALAALKLLPA